MENKNYNFKGWNHYYKKDKRCWVTYNENCLNYLVKYLPTYIDSVLIFGCANGRDFIPFQNKYKLYGMDIVPQKYIDFVKKFNNFKYYECSIEDFSIFIKDLVEFKDLSKFLIYTQGTMMYLTKKHQVEFYDLCKRLGCKNFIFHEYRIYSHDEEKFLYLEKVEKNFILKDYRKKDYGLNAHILLDISEEQKQNIVKEEV